MKLNVTRYLVPAALLTLAMAGDILVQRFEGLSEWDSLDVAFCAVRFGLFFGAGAFLFGRRAQWAYVSLWCLFCGVLAIECVARLNFGMVLGGDWVMILLASSGEEIREFSRQFSIPVVISVALALPLVLAAGVWALRKTPGSRTSSARLSADNPSAVGTRTFRSFPGRMTRPVFSAHTPCPFGQIGI